MAEICLELEMKGRAGVLSGSETLLDELIRSFLDVFRNLQNILDSIDSSGSLDNRED